jgi:hypothetical protein
MGTRFTEDKLWSDIKGLPLDKAPDPDDFMACFFQVAWSVIRHDIMFVFDAFWHLDTWHLHNTNDALMVVLQKTADATTIRDYRSIALIHSTDKLITKALVPRLGELVHVSQNAFIKGRFIQDSLKLIQASAKQLHARKVPNLLLKVDIARAFDSVSWSFLLHVMRVVGFSTIWHDWVYALLSSASTKVLLNGTLGERVCHTCGLCQGNHPLSPMLFLLIMEVLSAMFRLADNWSLL